MRKKRRNGQASIIVTMLILTILSSPLITVVAVTTSNISNDPEDSLKAAIAISNSNDIYIVWQGEGPFGADIFLASSTDNYGTVVNISNDPEESTNPAIATSSNDDIYVAWMQDVGTDIDIFLANSTDNYASPINISNNTGVSADPALAISGSDDVYVVWRDEGSINTDIFLANSTDNYASPINISNNDGQSEFPRIAISEIGDVYVAWQDDGPDSTDIFLASSADSYSNAVNISDNLGGSSEPAIAISSNGDVYISWQDDGPESSDIFLSSSTDGYSSVINVSNGTLESSKTDLALFNDDIYVVWKDIDFLQTGLGDVYAARKLAGEEFGGAINISVNAGGFVSDPQGRIAVPSDGNVAIVWNGDGPDSPDIFLAQDISFVLPTITIDSSSHGNMPRWDIDEFLINGNVTDADAGDTVSVDWGDGFFTGGISIEGDGSWSASRFYDSSAVFSNPNQVVAMVVGSDFSTRATSDPISVTVDKHATTLSLNPVASVAAGSNVEAAGVLVDTDTASEIEGATITFNGTGADDLGPELTAIDGLYSASGASPATAEDLLTVQARFDGDDLYFESSSSIRTYDTVDGSATTFAVSAGPDITVDLTGFGASVDFDEVETAGDLFVSFCDTPADTRYISMDLCLRLSSGFVMAPDSYAHVEVSFDGVEIRDGYTEDDASIFHEETSGVVDITESRDVDEDMVTGVTNEFSNFVVGIAVHDPQPANSVRKPVFVGDESEIALRDMSNPENLDAEISLDKSSYGMSDAAELTIVDHDANLDIDEEDSVTAIVTSETSGPAGGIDLSLQETGARTGIFVANFTFTAGASSGSALQASSGDEISIEYDQVFGARFEASFEGVEEAGEAQVSDHVIDEDEEDNLPFDPVGYSVELELLDASLASNGNITITMSYANGLFLGDAQRELLKMYRGERLGDDSVDWDASPISTADSGGFTIGVDKDAETVTVTTNSPGLFMLGYEIGEPGGGGGGLPRPGTGIVLDAIATIAGDLGGEDGDDDTSSGGGGGKRVVVVTNNPSASLSINILPDSHFDDNPLDRVEIYHAGFVDADGNEIANAGVGQQVSITSSFSNHQQEPQSYSFIVLVIDKDGFAVDIMWQEGVVESGQSAVLSTSWTPQQAGTFTIKMFVWDGLDNPSPLSQALTSDISAA